MFPKSNQTFLDSVSYIWMAFSPLSKAYIKPMAVPRARLSNHCTYVMSYKRLLVIKKAAASDAATFKIKKLSKLEFRK